MADYYFKLCMHNLLVVIKFYSCDAVYPWPQEHAHPSGLYLKCSILLRHDPHDVRLPSVMEETLSNSELTLELALSTVRLAAQHNRSMISL